MRNNPVGNMEKLYLNAIKIAQSLLINNKNNQFIPENPLGSLATGLEPGRKGGTIKKYE